MTVGKWEDPVSKDLIELRLVPARELANSPFQRPLSTSLVSKLHPSVGTGFLVPIIAVETPEGELEVIDGQHRLQALKDTRGDDALVPVIVAPLHWRYKPLYLNIEKTDNVKDKCEKVFALYQHYLVENPDAPERDIMSPFISPHLLTLAFAYSTAGLSSPSLVETLVKKFDHYLTDPLREAKMIRELRAGKVAAIEAAVLDLGIKDFNLRKAVVSQSVQKLWGRKRIITGVSFQEAMDAVLQVIGTEDWSHLMKEF